jgi:hypothetical protein
MFTPVLTGERDSGAGSRLIAGAQNPVLTRAEQILNSALNVIQLAQAQARSASANLFQRLLLWKSALVPTSINFEFQWRKILDWLERSRPTVLLATTVDAEITRYDPQPSAETGSAIRPKLQQAVKTTPRELLADVKKTISGLVYIPSARSSGLIKDWIILL